MTLSKNLPGYAALGVLILLLVAMVRRRFSWGYMLLHLAVALGERWQDARVKARLGAALATLPDSDPEECDDGEVGTYPGFSGPSKAGA
jgi:hypothetical protein